MTPASLIEARLVQIWLDASPTQRSRQLQIVTVQSPYGMNDARSRVFAKAHAIVSASRIVMTV